MDEGTVPGGGAAYVHLSEMIPFIKSSIEDLDEHIGADIVAKVQCSLSLSLGCCYQSADGKTSLLSLTHVFSSVSL